MRLYSAVVVVLMLPTVALARDKADKPILVLNAGGHTGNVGAVMFTPDGRELISVSRDATIRCWSMQTGETLRILRPWIIPGGHNVGTGQYGGAALSPNGKTLAVACGGTEPRDQSLLLIELASERVLHVIPAQHTTQIMRLRFSPDGAYLASGAYLDGAVRLWNVASGKCEQILRGHTSSIRGLAFSADGKRLATSSGDETARIWSLATGKTEVVLKDTENRAFTVRVCSITCLTVAFP